MFDYDNHFWDYVKGRPNAEEFIAHGRTTDTGSYQMPTATADKYEKAIAGESVFRGITSVFSSYDRDSDILASDNDDIAEFVPGGGSIDITDLADDFTRMPIFLRDIKSLICTCVRSHHFLKTSLCQDVFIHILFPYPN